MADNTLTSEGKKDGDSGWKGESKQIRKQEEPILRKTTA
jgi:hypothetical protein